MTASDGTPWSPGPEIGQPGTGQVPDAGSAEVAADPAGPGSTEPTQQERDDYEAGQSEQLTDPIGDASAESVSSDASPTDGDATTPEGGDDGVGNEHRFRVTHVHRKPNGGGLFHETGSPELKLSELIAWARKTIGEHTP
jgi:hypothetical protein